MLPRSAPGWRAGAARPHRKPLTSVCIRVARRPVLPAAACVALVVLYFVVAHCGTSAPGAGVDGPPHDPLSALAQDPRPVTFPAAAEPAMLEDSAYVTVGPGGAVMPRAPLVAAAHQASAAGMDAGDVVDPGPGSGVTASATAVARRSALPPVSAVFINWKRRESLADIMCYLHRLYSHFIAEYVVWDNSGTFDVDLLPPRCAAHLVTGAQGPLVRVIDSSRHNIATKGRYTACAAAVNDVCLFLDDDFYPRYLNTLMAQYLLAPQLLHANTNADVYYHNMKWSFVDPSIGLHTGFSWVGCGALASKRAVQRFLAKLDSVAEGVTEEVSQLIDNVFALWMNAFPAQIENVLFEVHQLQDNSVRMSRPDAIESFARTRRFAIETLWQHLDATVAHGADLLDVSLDGPVPGDAAGSAAVEAAGFELWDPEPAGALLPLTHIVYRVRAPCSDDACGFIASPDPFDFDTAWVSVDEADSRMVWEVFADDAERDAYARFRETPYHRAVDTDPATQWCATFQPGDFFGLDMHHATAGPVRLQLHMGQWMSGGALPFSVETSLDGSTWLAGVRWSARGSGFATSSWGGPPQPRFDYWPPGDVFRFVRWVYTGRAPQEHCVFEVARLGTPLP